jgi:hypothetical protein
LLAQLQRARSIQRSGQKIMRSGDARGRGYDSVAESCLCGAVTVPDFDFDGAAVERNDGAAWPSGVFGEDDSAGAHAGLDRSLRIGPHISALDAGCARRNPYERSR